MARVFSERVGSRPAAPPTPPARHTGLGLPDADVVAMYRTVLLARMVDQKAWNLTRTGKARFFIPAEGQEATQVGSAWAVKAGHDIALPYYRDIGVVLTLGMTAYEVLLAVFARAEDPNSGGRQMPNHWGSKRLGIITGSSPIGTQFPHAAGLALASTLRGDDRVTVTWFGEAAASKGDFHEAMNFAGIHRLPAVFVCENNGYAISVGMDKQSAVPDVADRAASYGFEGVVVDGNDLLAVYEATSAAVDLARAGGGPTLVEAKTYRLMPHTSDDDDKAYRSSEEVAAARRLDPLPRLKDYVVEHGLLSPEGVSSLESSVRDEVADACERAEAAAAPEPHTAAARVYARPVRRSTRAGAPAPAPPVVQPPPGGVARTVLETVRQTLHDLMAEDERVVVLGEDVGVLGGVFRATRGLHGAFGEDRVIDTPLAESSIVGISVGLALAGMRPVAEIQFADFMHSTFDQMVSEAAKIHYRSNGDFNVPMVVRTPWGGGGHRGPYHSQAVEAFYAHVAGLKVVVPSTPADVAGLLRSAVEDPDPVLFLEHKKTYRKITGLVPDGQWRVPIGLADVARPGDDMTIVTYGLHRHLSLEAAEVLAGEDYSVEVIDLRTISPLDRETVLASAIRTGRVLVVHEDNISFGVGAEVAAMVAEEAFYDLDTPVRRLA
ncbi:MAG: dehydrogenase E1 component subunit alpha/beta, partial [Actinomycetota bacterium]|nr:dehydrogenase E1 component subunit alpha/beta [Actinomycetota bacterium]